MGDRRAWSGAWSAASGFTIIEVVMVLCIIVLIGAIAMPAVSSMIRGEQLRAPARELESMAITARCNAFAEQRPYRIILDSDGFRLENPEPGGPPLATYRLPSGVAFRLASWPAEQWQTPKNRLWYFSPGGLCEPISVEFRKGESFFAQKYSAITGWDQEESFFYR